jgi:hypothetical protein
VRTTDVGDVPQLSSSEPQGCEHEQGNATRSTRVLLMNRINALEIHEQPWLPRSIRDGVTDTLQFVLKFGGVYQPIVSRLAKALTSAGDRRLIDFCSGGGGPWIWLYRALARQNDGPLSIQLTDKFPNLAAFERAEHTSNGEISYCTDSIDATRIPARLDGFRTMFTSFHHFPPTEAGAIIQSAVDSRQGIGIFEAPARTPLSISLTFLVPLMALLSVPFVRPFRLSLLLWTYLIPVIPFVLWFDGVVSCLRAYSPIELSAMISDLKTNDYTWEIGEEIGWIAPVTYMLGYPPKSASGVR